MHVAQKIRGMVVGLFLLCSLGSNGCGGSPVEDPKEIAGTWVWFNTPTIYIDANGDLRAPGTAVIGRWASVDVANRQYQLSWGNGFIDRVTLSVTGNELDGYNQIGTHVTAIRAH
jgi:hypothetical protein